MGLSLTKSVIKEKKKHNKTAFVSHLRGNIKEQKQPPHLAKKEESRQPVSFTSGAPFATAPKAREILHVQWWRKRGKYCTFNGGESAGKDEECYKKERRARTRSGGGTLTLIFNPVFSRLTASTRAGDKKPATRKKVDHKHDS